jgi:hypothetical protein
MVDVDRRDVLRGDTPAASMASGGAVLGKLPRTTEYKLNVLSTTAAEDLCACATSEILGVCHAAPERTAPPAATLR